MDGMAQWTPAVALPWVWHHLGEARGEWGHYTGGLYKRALHRQFLWGPRWLYLSLSSRVTRLVIRPHIRPIRNRIQMLPLITDRM